MLGRNKCFIKAVSLENPFTTNWDKSLANFQVAKSPRKKAIARGYTVSQAHYYRGVGDSAANTETIYVIVAFFSFICSVDTRGWRDGTDGHIEENKEKIMKTNK